MRNLERTDPQEETTGAIGIRKQDWKELWRRREFAKIYRKTTGLETTKQITRSTVGLRKIKDWTLWRDQPPRPINQIIKSRTHNY
jgi:hypothetical protein